MEKKSSGSTRPVEAGMAAGGLTRGVDSLTQCRGQDDRVVGESTEEIHQVLRQMGKSSPALQMGFLKAQMEKMNRQNRA